MTGRVVVVALDEAALERARGLASSLSLPLGAGDADVLLEVGVERLQLRLATTTSGPVSIDLVGGRVGRRRREAGLKKSELARAVGVAKGARPFVVDATAGLGVDSALLAWMGCRVLAVEQSAALAALWREATERSRDALPQLTFAHDDARAVLCRLADERDPPDVVYLDPMFPARSKSALVKKEMQLLQALHGDAPAGADEDLLRVARAVARERVVVKRPRGAPPLAAGVSHDIAGKTTRFDVYVRARG